MVNIDNVYQKVLTLINKEQRGHLTPQEFNLLADKAQMEVINDTFHALKTAYHKRKNATEAFDETEMLQEKLSPLRNRVQYITSNGIIAPPGSAEATFYPPESAYYVSSIQLLNCKGVSLTEFGVEAGIFPEIVRVTKDELTKMMQHPLTRPSIKRPVYVAIENMGGQTITYRCYAGIQGQDPLVNTIGTTNISGVEYDYFEKPPTPRWAYVVVNGKALYNSNQSVHFQIHKMEEENLVTRILELAGVTILKPDITAHAMRDKMNTKQTQNS